MSTLLQKLFLLQFWLRQRRLSVERPVISRDGFVEQVVAAGGDASAAALIWTFLQEWLVADGFSAYPEDDLDRVFGIAEEELEVDLVCGTLKQLGLPLPNQATIDEFIATFEHINSPLRVAQLVARMRRDTR